MSGGFPHSDIHGSKPIPGSPWLNAGYHVLHRLLLPRHPPNALFALDLIQKEPNPLVHRLPSQDQKQYFPTVPRRIVTPVSVLDLENSIVPGLATRYTLTRAYQTIPMFLSIRCQFGVRHPCG